jgi:hypothetical protein
MSCFHAQSATSKICPPPLAKKKLVTDSPTIRSTADCAPLGKLRMLYEASPMSFLTSHATTDTQVIIGLVPKSRCLVFLGSKEDVKDLMKFDKGVYGEKEW